MTRVWLVRHGESLLNAVGRVQGWADAPLTVAGAAQASARRAEFERIGCRFDAVVSADGIRHRETARALVPGGTVVEDVGWREACFGRYEGTRNRRLRRILVGHRGCADPVRATLEELAGCADAEHPDAVVSRALTALDRAGGAGHEVLVVTSGITIMLLLGALGADLDHVVTGPPHLSVSTVEGGPGAWRVTRAVDGA